MPSIETFFEALRWRLGLKSKKRMHRGLIDHVDEAPNLNAEFNEYTEYYLESIRAKSRGTFLIVEDDPMYGLFLEVAIHSFNPEINCIFAVSVEEALQNLKTVACDLVIADYFLEGDENGLDLCRKIGAFYPKTKCLVISSMDFWDYRSRALGSEVPPEFMEKPLSPVLIKKYLSQFFEEIHS